MNFDLLDFPRRRVLRWAHETGTPSNPFSGFASQRAQRGGPMFEEEISPEELFRQFFGGGMGGFGGMGPFGGGMGGGPGFVFNMGGGPGIRVHQFGGGAPRRRPHNHVDAQPTSPLETLRSLLPLLLLFILPLLSSLFSAYRALSLFIGDDRLYCNQCGRLMTSSALSYDIDAVDMIQTESELSNDRSSRHLLSSGF